VKPMRRVVADALLDVACVVELVGWRFAGWVADAWRGLKGAGK